MAGTEVSHGITRHQRNFKSSRHGRYAGEFRSLHNLAIDSKGNIYTGEAGFGRRVQKFVRSD